MKKIFFVFAILLSGFSFSQEVRWGAIANVHSSSIEGIHDFSRGRIAPSVGLFMEIPLETFQRSIYSPLRYYIFPVVEYSMEGEKTILEQGRQYFRNDFVALALYGKFHFYRGFFENFYFMVGPRVAYNISEKRAGPTNQEAGYTNLRDDDMKKLNISASSAFGYVVSDKMELYLRYDHGLTKVYPNYTDHKTWNRILGIGVSYYFN